MTAARFSRDDAGTGCGLHILHTTLAAAPATASGMTVAASSAMDSAPVSLDIQEPSRRPAWETSTACGSKAHAILDAALDLLRTGGAPAITMRAIAARCALSPTALYVHCGSKRDLLEALRQRGADELDEMLAAARGDLLALCRGYLSFARLEPWLYRLMFGSSRLGRADCCVDVFTARAAAILSREPAATLQDTWTRSRQLWLGLHGAALAADLGGCEPGSTGAAEPLEPEFAESYLRALIRGIGAEPTDAGDRQ